MKVSKRAYSALLKSIEHWEENLHRAYGEEKLVLGCRACRLCDVHYYVAGKEKRCIFCPIKQKTGRAFCGRTPYQAVVMSESLRAVTNELNFLYALADECEVA